MSTPGVVDAQRRGLETDSLLYALRVVRERWWIIALSTVLVTGVAVAMSLRSPDVYEATSKVLFGGSQVTDSAFGIQRNSGQPEREAATQVIVATSPKVADRTRKVLETELSRDDLLAKVTVQAADNADVLTFTAQDGDPREAAAIANAFAEAYQDVKKESEVAQLDASEKSLQIQFDNLPDNAPERADLQQRLGTLQSYRAAANGGAERLGAAAVPSARAAPRPKRDALLGLILGLVLGLTVSFLLDLFDRRVKTVEDFERHYRMRALASVPQLSFSARTAEERALAFEPFRVLRNAIGFAELNHRLDVIMVTSAMPAEGKSTVAMNLARAIALSGQRVVLVECDLRRPSLARHLGIDTPGGGLTTALVGRRPATELLVPVTSGLPHLSLLPSGPLPPNAAELLRSPRMSAVLSELAADGARIVIDAPPLLPVADAQGLLDQPQIDAALVVARTFQTTHEEARRGRAVLDQHRLQPLGIVVTGLPEESSYGYYGVEPTGAEPPPGSGTVAPADAPRSAARS